MSNPLVLIQLSCVDLPVQTGLDPPRMTARVQETLIAVTIASVAVHMNATISKSLIATPLHTEGDPVLGSRLLPDIWTSPASPIRLTIRHRENVSHLMCHSRDDPPPGGHRHLTAVPVAYPVVPVAYSEAHRLTAVSVAYPEARRLTADPVAYSEARRLTADPVASQRTPSPAQKSVASWQTPSPTQRRIASRLTPSPTQRRVASKGSPPPKRMAFAPGAGPSFARRPLSRDSRSPRRSSRDSLSPKRGSPSPKRRRYEVRDSVSPPLITSLVSRALTRETPFTVFSYSPFFSFERREGS